MSDVVIKVENLSKKYILSHHGQEKYTALRDIVTQGAKRLGKKLLSPFTLHPLQSPDSLFTDSTEDFYALRDVSFEIKQGDRVGIIGRNGAGKSTLLKILSRITEPTSGRIEITGRVASLLEVGTGFHPELTGRENIFLNGAILGMGKAEIKRKFDEIVDFAEVEKFLDTPVKRYSSGMYVRLAFAVAAHLEPEILIVDEVLAVGDAQFQKKCLGKMEEVGNEGRTVLFVSHNMGAVENLCDSGVVLHKGENAFKGGVEDSIAYYMNSLVSQQNGSELRIRTDRKGSGNIRIIKMVLEDDQGFECDAFPIGSNINFKIDYESSNSFSSARIILGIYDFMSVGVTRFDTDVAAGLPRKLPATGTIVCRTKQICLTPGRYHVNIAFFNNDAMEDYLINAISFDVIGSDYFGTGRNFDDSDARLTKALFRHVWNCSQHS